MNTEKTYQVNENSVLSTPSLIVCFRDHCLVQFSVARNKGGSLSKTCSSCSYSEFIRQLDRVGARRYVSELFVIHTFVL